VLIQEGGEAEDRGFEFYLGVLGVLAVEYFEFEPPRRQEGFNARMIILRSLYPLPLHPLE
jgi:hypothetical protein